MAEGKNIQIRIAATGGDQAAAEVQKVGQANNNLDASLGIVIKSEEELAAARSRFMSAAEAEVAEVERMVQAANKLKQALPAVPFSQTGNVIAEMANGPLKNGAAGIKNLGMTFTQVGYQVTDFATQVSMGTSAFTAFAQQAPQAIAAMTQFGAAGSSLSQVLSANVGAMMPLSLIVTELAIGIPMVVNAYKQMRSEIESATAAEQTAWEMQSKLNDVLAFGADAYFGASEAAAKLVEITNQSTEAIDAEKKALENRNAVLDADAAAYKAKRDREDAAKIRAGADPESVKIERANSDEAEALRRIDREMELKRAGLTEASNAAVKAEAQVGITKVAPDSTPEMVAEAEKKASELKARADKMAEDVAQAERIAQAKRTEIRESTAGKIEDLAYQRSQRKADEEKKAADKAKREADAESRKQDAEDRKKDTAAGRRALEEADVGRDAVSLIPKDASAKARAAIETAAAKLQDGAQGKEIEELLSLVNAMAGYIERTKGSESASNIKIKQLSERIRRLEGK